MLKIFTFFGKFNKITHLCDLSFDVQLLRENQAISNILVFTLILARFSIHSKLEYEVTKKLEIWCQN